MEHMKTSTAMKIILNQQAHTMISQRKTTKYWKGALLCKNFITI